MILGRRARVKPRLVSGPSSIQIELKSELILQLIVELFFWPITSDFRANREILAKKSELKSELILQLKSELICPTWHCQHRYVARTHSLEGRGNWPRCACEYGIC